MNSKPGRYIDIKGFVDGWPIANAVDREGEHMTGQGKQGDHTKGRKPVIV